MRSDNRRWCILPIIIQPYSQSSPFSELDNAQWPSAYIIAVHRNPVFRQYPVIRETGVLLVGHPPKRNEQKNLPVHNLRVDSWVHIYIYIHIYVQYEIKDSDHSLCPWCRDDDNGAQISFGDDHRWPGVARLLFFFSSFLRLILYFLRTVATGPVGTKTWSGES